MLGGGQLELSTYGEIADASQVRMQFVTDELRVALNFVEESRRRVAG